MVGLNLTPKARGTQIARVIGTITPARIAVRVTAEEKNLVEMFRELGKEMQTQAVAIARQLKEDSCLAKNLKKLMNSHLVDGEPITTKELAKRTGVPEYRINSLLNPLAGADVIPLHGHAA
jgi:hypothetical protein